MRYCPRVDKLKLSERETAAVQRLDSEVQNADENPKGVLVFGQKARTSTSERKFYLVLCFFLSAFFSNRQPLYAFV